MSAQGLFQGGPWLRWLEAVARAQDCKLSSHARRALLNLRSAQASAAAQVRRAPAFRVSGSSFRV